MIGKFRIASILFTLVSAIESAPVCSRSLLPVELKMGDSEEIRQEHNVWSSKYFAVSMGAIMFCFMICHWSNFIYFHFRPRTKFGTFFQKLFLCSRYGKRQTANMASIIVFNGLTWYRVVQCFLGGKVFGLAIGRSLLYMLFWAINLILLLTNVKLEAEYVCPHYLRYA